MKYVAVQQLNEWNEGDHELRKLHEIRFIRLIAPLVHVFSS